MKKQKMLDLFAVDAEDPDLHYESGGSVIKLQVLMSTKATEASSSFTKH